MMQKEERITAVAAVSTIPDTFVKKTLMMKMKTLKTIRTEMTMNSQKPLQP